MLSTLLEAGSRGRIKDDDAVAYQVQAAGALCPAALPLARSAYTEHFGN